MSQTNQIIVNNQKMVFPFKLPSNLSRIRRLLFYVNVFSCQD